MHDKIREQEHLVIKKRITASTLIKQYKYFYVCLLMVCLALLIYKNHLIINTTPSMPKGIYVNQLTSTIQIGDTVAICLPDHLKKVALKRGYIGKGIYCQGSMPLIKQVVAVPGQMVTVEQNRILVNNKLYPIKFFKQDGQHQSLEPIHFGKYISTGYWVLGINHSRSWDSRYFGELPSSAILCVLKPILIWNF